jgi:predicted nuclease of predicted toxin-antitoxin system
VRVLLDENLPHDLAALLVGHQADTVAGCGWSGTKNGELLRLASTNHQAFLTMDRRLPDQQHLEDFPFAVLLLLAPSNRMFHLRPLVPHILAALDTAAPGTLTTVAA